METNETPALKLYAPGQIAVAAFLGSPIAACWFLACNYRQLGSAKAANHCLVWGVISTVLLFVISFHLPANFPSQALPAGYIFGSFQFAKQAHGSAIALQLASGGELGSWWKVVGISLALLLLVLIVVGMVLTLFPSIG